MNWHLFTIGKPRLSFVRTGVDEYIRRLRPLANVTLEPLKAAAQRETESLQLLERSKGCFRIVLDERGEELTSRQLTEKISAWELAGQKNVAILIGGADGHTEALRANADWVWSLSRLTLQHELALLLLCEQLYRVYSIKAGMPYHRD